MIGTATNREEENHTVPPSLVFLSRVAADDLTPAIATRASQRSRCDEAMDTIKAYIVRKRLHPGDFTPSLNDGTQAIHYPLKLNFAR